VHREGEEREHPDHEDDQPGEDELHAGKADVGTTDAQTVS
jgi:hypothetical protein